MWSKCLVKFCQCYAERIYYFTSRKGRDKYVKCLSVATDWGYGNCQSDIECGMFCDCVKRDEPITFLAFSVAVARTCKRLDFRKPFDKTCAFPKVLWGQS